MAKDPKPPKRRTQVKDLPGPKRKQLGKAELKKVKGGAADPAAAIESVRFKVGK